MNMFIEERDNDWPDYERFPYNYSDKQVASVIQRDLDESKNPLIITGYASLDRIIDFLAYCYSKLRWNPDAFDTIRILLGNEPYPTKAQKFRNSGKFSQEIEDYWLERGISILKCGKVIAAIELIKNGKVQTRIARNKPIHAKIYNGENAITIGSSNYSTSGLCWQIEGNVRFRRTRENARFHEACQLAESIWELGRNYNEELIKLLEQLLSKVSWQEALARACVELLEGEWAKKYKPTSYLGDELLLWPAQEKGIAQAIWVIENVGSVLIADATGSGKTRMGSHLIKCVMNHIWKTGRMRQDMPVMICPPAVEEAWDEEFTNCSQSVKTVSHGLLSNSASNKDDDTTSPTHIRAIRRAQVLAVDEAHNFLNRHSQRTQTLFSNMADYVLLFTATPINRGTQDLLAIIELLGADNFDDELLEVLRPIWSKRNNLNEKISPAVREKVQRTIQQFTVRRTKTMLNRMIAEEPERYKDLFGKPCRYPKHKSEIYSCGETNRDRTLAQEIREATQRLLGLVNLKETLELPEFLRKEGWTDEKYLEWRLKSAQVLAAYQVMACLRSSRAALLEHIYGTKNAQEYFNLLDNVKGKETGNLRKTLQNIAGKHPKNKLQVELPDWLSSSSNHKRACQEEIDIYEHIAELSKQISEWREETKTSKLIQLLDTHKLVIAFDSRPLTLHDIKRRLEKYQHGEALIATGANKTDRKRINELFKLGSKESGIIALCSDAMSEGVNLQQASAVVQLTMPSVIRLAEQRIGRVDRMDSPHSTIEVWWPEDSEEFALRSSERKFLARHGLVSDLLGSNVPLPKNSSQEKNQDLSNEAVTPEEDIATLKLEQAVGRRGYELGDVFDPVRSLVEGDQPLVPRQDYDKLRASKARVVSALSVVEAQHPWAFFAIAGTEWGAPRWVYLDYLEATPITDLEQISQKLRENLVSPVKDCPLEIGTTWLEKFLNILKQTEELLLPKKKQRALVEMKWVLKKYKEKAAKDKDIEREWLVQEWLVLVEEESRKQRIDLSILAEQWLDLIRPWWFERLKKRRPSTPLRLKHLSQDLIEKPIETQKLREALKVPEVKPLDERIVAAIIGVP
jgi:superfamily II DNA or RNA helicase